MSEIESVVPGSAAFHVAIGGAQTAALPLKAKAGEYVKVCSLYGACFYFIAGTGTCIRVSGYFPPPAQRLIAPPRVKQLNKHRQLSVGEVVWVLGIARR